MKEWTNTDCPSVRKEFSSRADVLDAWTLRPNSMQGYNYQPHLVCSSSTVGLCWRRLLKAGLTSAADADSDA